MQMEAKLYVGNLPFKMTDDELFELFSGAGVVKSASIVRDRESNRSKGFGFVVMESDEAAQSAISTLNNRSIGDREITVSMARPREEQPNRRRSGGGGGGGGGHYSGNRRSHDGGGRGGKPYSRG